MRFEIFADYCLQGRTRWEHTKLEPQSFIEDDDIAIASWAQLLSAADYLRINEKELDKTVVRIFVRGSGEYITLKWTHWNNGKSWIFEQTGYYDHCEHYEISVKDEVNGEDKIESLLKMERASEGNLELLHHSANLVKDCQSSSPTKETNEKERKHHLS